MRIDPLQFADVDGLAIAWERYGEGPDCVVIPPLISNIELLWEHEYYRRALEFMGRHMTVTHLDVRGMGLSDHPADAPTLKQRINDVIGVMDAAGLESAHILAISGAGLIAQCFAATYPERVQRMVLANSGVLGYEQRPDWAARSIEGWPRIIENWGVDAQFNVEWWSPSNAENPAFVRWWSRYQRQAATATEFAKQLESFVVIFETPDDFLDRISAPTLVLNSSNDRVIDPASGDVLAPRIRGAERRIVTSDDHFFFLGDHWLEASTEILEFLLETAVDEPTERRLASVVFTDIVGSTSQLAALGDRAWAAALDEHDRIAWELADRHGGTIVKSTGDGLLVRLDSPSRAVDFACELAIALDAAGIQIRVGIHSGEIEIRPDKDITGIAVNLAARVEQAAPDGAIYVSSTVRDTLLGGEQRFEDRGDHNLKGIDGAWRLYEVVR